MKHEVRPYIIRPYIKGEERYVAELQNRIYSEEYHWGTAFTDYAMELALAFSEKEKRDREELWIAEADGKPVGCIMLCETDDYETGQLRLFVVEKDYRKFGIGRALVEALFEKARGSGYKRLMLWTASLLKDALRMYERLGFQETERVTNKDWSISGEQIYEIKMELEL